MREDSKMYIKLNRMIQYPSIMNKKMLWIFLQQLLPSLKVMKLNNFGKKKTITYMDRPVLVEQDINIDKVNISLINIRNLKK